MGLHIMLRHSDLRPAQPLLRETEVLVRDDRIALHCRFGEPCNPRRLADIYDVSEILETYADYEVHYGRSVDGEFESVARWSGATIPTRDSNHLVLINPEHGTCRRTVTIAHEFGHLARNHHPISVGTSGSMPETRYSDDQEWEAWMYALAILLPYAPLVQMLDQRATVRGIAYHYGVSTAAVDMRLKTTGLWSMRR